MPFWNKKPSVANKSVKAKLEIGDKIADSSLSTTHYKVLKISVLKSVHHGKEIEIYRMVCPSYPFFSQARNCSEYLCGTLDPRDTPFPCCPDWQSGSCGRRTV